MQCNKNYLKVKLSPSRKLYYFVHWKPFKNYEKWFLFHLKSSFCSQDIQVFVMTFWPCMRKGLIRKIRLISKFMTSQQGYETITIHILPKISRSKGNQTTKYGQSIEYNKRNTFLQNLCRKWGRETSSRPRFVFWNCWIWSKSKWSVT